MSCPTCDHTLEAIGRLEGTYHCPRCGTLKSWHGGEHEDVYVPTLPRRVRTFLEGVTQGGEMERARRIGLYESIMPPEARP